VERHRRVNSARGDSQSTRGDFQLVNRDSYSKCVFGPAGQLVASRIAFYLLVADMWQRCLPAQGTPSLYYCPDPDHHIADQSEFLKGSERLDIFELSHPKNIYRRS